MVDMARKEILPAVAAYEKDLADTLEAKLKMLPELTGRYERRAIAKLSGLVDEIDAAAEELDSATIRLKNHKRRCGSIVLYTGRYTAQNGRTQGSVRRGRDAYG